MTQLKKLSHSGAILRNKDLMTDSFLLGQFETNYNHYQSNVYMLCILGKEND